MLKYNTNVASKNDVYLSTFNNMEEYLLYILSENADYKKKMPDNSFFRRGAIKIYYIEYYAAIRKEFLPFKTTWRVLC